MELDKTTKIQFNSEQKSIWGIKGIVQWDQGQKLEISGLGISNEIVEVHFSLEEFQGSAKRMLGVVKDGVIYADIPAFVLEGPGYCNGIYLAYAWVYVSDDKSAETIRKIEFTIEARPKPEEYVTPDELSFLQQLEAYIGRKLDKSGYAPNMYLGTDEDGNVVTMEGSAVGGKDGASAYEIALANGFKGTEEEWLESLQGKDGYTPEKGVDYWTEEELKDFEMTVNKVTVIDENSTDEQYPSAKAVVDFTNKCIGYLETILASI